MLLNVRMFLVIITTSVAIKSRCKAIMTTLVGQWVIFNCVWVMFLNNFLRKNYLPWFNLTLPKNALRIN